MKEPKSQFATLVHCINIAINVSLFAEKELNISEEFTKYNVDDKIAASYQTNISPKASYPTFQTIKMNSLIDSKSMPSKVC